MKDSYIYLDTYVLQKDMRIRMPKSILSNMDAEKGKTKFNIYFDPATKMLLLEINEEAKDLD